MLMAAAAVLVGLAVLIWSSERFIEGAVGTAHHLRLPSFIIGTVIVGVGTSAPEFLVSGLAAWQGQPGLAIGNAYGSNIANIGLILGVALLLSPMAVGAGIVRREMALLIVVTLMSRWLIGDGSISRFDALLLVLPLIGYIAVVAFEARRNPAHATSTAPTPDDTPSDVPPFGRSLVWLVVGLALLLASSRLLVWGASTIAGALGVSDLVIGLTVVAVGTSLPELASSISAVRRRAYDLVLGNVVGSNLFNTLGVVGVAGLITPIDVDPSVLSRDWPIMLGLTLLLLVFAMRFGSRPAHLNRIEGGVFLLSFVAYTAWLVFGAFTAAA
ncbi:K+-dependent Na+/Ca+ exchanger-like protein [Salinisphaera sp. C84B14]|uniref:calcium/sodium antiporter n=1 Tax=Salinisphaera sp. C84B14 TaxID=1304155 RepID=UPI00333ED54E